MDRGIFDSIDVYSLAERYHVIQSIYNILNYIDALLETMTITNCILYLKQDIYFNEKKENKQQQITAFHYIIRRKKKNKKTT